MTDQQEPKPQAVDLKAWQAAALHYPLLPSGSRVGLKIIDLPGLIEAGEIPQHLLDAALGIVRAQKDEAQVPSAEEITANMAKEREFTDTVVKLSVVQPDLSKAAADDLKAIPYEDKQFIVAVATRARDLDVEGEHIAGLTKSEKFRKFRELGEFAPNVEGL